jgi:hypothetical protein
VWTTVPLRSAVVFTDIEDISVYGPDRVTVGLDLNFDNVVDVELRNLGHEFAAFSTVTGRVAGLTAVPPNQNNFAAAFVDGDTIGSSFSFYAWNTGYSGLISCRDTGCLGFYSEGQAYLGVEFQIAGMLHYGWVLIENPLAAGGGVIGSFAYESEAGVSIVAGAIPEPSTVALLSGSTALLLQRNGKTRKQQNKTPQRTARGWVLSTFSVICRCLGFGGAQTRRPPGNWRASPPPAPWG